MLKLLIVDDSNVVRRKIQRLLDLKNIKVVGHAQNGLEAVRLFRALLPDLITMDITMPEMDGVQAVEQIIGINPNVKILVISALADKETAIEAVKKGASGFLTKPFDEAVLNEAFQELLAED